ncbi:hypothetical protein EXU57_07945 [Segetibacter sp. 3557_3]|nr:hypothetical protein EXU57_07945 [Segetibacter sp. 3557_3]
MVLLAFFCASNLSAQPVGIANNNIAWTSQSSNSGSSMPCGGGDVGLNVWTENGDILFYIGRSGSFDEHNTLLKHGRVRLSLSPNPFSKDFRQELTLQDGRVKISGNDNALRTEVTLWVDVFKPVIHVAVNSSRPVQARATFESWRYRDRPVKGRANNGTSYKWAPQGEIITYKDSINFIANGIEFYHRNRPQSIFNVTVKQQGLDSISHRLFNPLRDLTIGGRIEGRGMKPAGIAEGKYLDTDFKGWSLQSSRASRTHELTVYLHTAQAPGQQMWKQGLDSLIKQANKTAATASKQSINWWQNFWNRSFIFIQPGERADSSAAWQVGRNYQLMRYMLGCNLTGSYPTKSNGGLFTYDPAQTDSALAFTPDYRTWGGGTFTAQNQRLVYFPMLKSGDLDLMKPQFDFYNSILRNAEFRTAAYWGHKGASFSEQMENFGLPNPSEYGWKRPADYDRGMEYNAWLEYEWDTVLEFCWMILETRRYGGKDISQYLSLIKSSLLFFDEHYQYLAKNRGSKNLDGNGQLVIYPGSAAETYKMAYNPSSTVSGLKTVLTGLLSLEGSYLDSTERKYFSAMLSRIPPISFATFGGKTTIAPARLWERINNTESPQLYPVFPWGIYGVGKPGLDTARNTYLYDTNVVKFKSHVGWKQDNIFAARLGLTEEAVRLNTLKLKNSGRRFPAFWGPGYDWTPDQNWGGAGMIGLQEMLLQTDGKRIMLFPAWPKEWDVHFKLHAPYNTTVEASLKQGKIEWMKVLPKEREQDVLNLYLN